MSSLAIPMYTGCHECESANRNVSSSIDNLKESIVQLTQSLSVDLGNFTCGFRTLSDTLVGNIAIVNRTQHNAPVCTNKRHREEYGDDMHNLPKKRIVLGSNDKDRNIAAVHVNSSEANSYDTMAAVNRRRSVVVSNIGNNITAN